MTTAKTEPAQRAPRADVQRNRQKLLDAAREAFGEHGTSTALEDIARRAGVGIGTLYRHFPTRQHLIEAAYIEEIEAMARQAEGLEDLAPWDALVAFLHRYAGYANTKRALGDALLDFMSEDAEVLRSCRTIIHDAGEPLLRRAQDAGVVREDVTFTEVARMVGGIATIRGMAPAEVTRIIDVALDGLRVGATPGA